MSEVTFPCRTLGLQPQTALSIGKGCGPLGCPDSNPASAIGCMGCVGPHFTIRCWCKELNVMAMLGVASGLWAAFMQRSADCCPGSGGIPALLWGQQGFGDV